MKLFIDRGTLLGVKKFFNMLLFHPTYLKHVYKVFNIFLQTPIEQFWRDLPKNQEFQTRTTLSVILLVLLIAMKLFSRLVNKKPLKAFSKNLKRKSLLQYCDFGTTEWTLHRANCSISFFLFFLQFCFRKQSTLSRKERRTLQEKQNYVTTEIKPLKVSTQLNHISNEVGYVHAAVIIKRAVISKK